MSVYDAKIRAEADKALGSIVADSAQALELQAVRKRVYDWLDMMVARCEDPSLYVDVQAQVLFPNDNLTSKSVRAVVKEFIGKVFPKGCIASRQDDERVWTPTSFLFDPDTKTLNVKIGTALYQPFAYDDGRHLVQTEAAKLLWGRRWSVTAAAEAAPPFDIVPNTELSTVTSAMFLTEAELKALDHAFTELQEEMGCFTEAIGTANEEEHIYRLRETIKLARIWSPTLDAKLEGVIKEKPEFGKNFENANIQEVARASLEYMAMRKDSHLAAAREAKIALQLPELSEPERQLIVVYLAEIRRILRVPVIDKEQLVRILTLTCTITSTPLPTATQDIIAYAFEVYNRLAPRFAVTSIDGGNVSTGGTGTDSAAPAASKSTGDSSASTGAGT